MPQRWADILPLPDYFVFARSGRILPDGEEGVSRPIDAMIVKLLLKGALELPCIASFETEAWQRYDPFQGFSPWTKLTERVTILVDKIEPGDRNNGHWDHVVVLSGQALWNGFETFPNPRQKDYDGQLVVSMRRYRKGLIFKKWRTDVRLYAELKPRQREKTNSSIRDIRRASM